MIGVSVLSLYIYLYVICYYYYYYSNSVWLSILFLCTYQRKFSPLSLHKYIYIFFLVIRFNGRFPLYILVAVLWVMAKPNHSSTRNQCVMESSSFFLSFSLSLIILSLFKTILSNHYFCLESQTYQIFPLFYSISLLGASRSWKSYKFRFRSNCH